jgi:hypothetical protein
VLFFVLCTNHGRKYRIIALIVAINKVQSPPTIWRFYQCLFAYQFQSDSICNLNKCLNDDRLISGEHNANIVMLEDGDATREDNISTFGSHLIDNIDIKPGSALVFYFAGHGTRVKAPMVGRHIIE